MATARSRSGPIQLSGRQPFNGSARLYFQRGWLPMPLPPKKKSKPPTGYTGWDATKRVTQKQLDAWLASVNPSSNIALRPDESYMGIDVDAYKETGEDTYTKIIEEIGGLPDTWISSARDDGRSGIRHYRLPKGAEQLQWPGKIGGGIETVHYGHRYIVAPPSIHPEKDGDGDTQVYAWYPPGELPYGVNASHELPPFETLTELPWDLVEYFTKGRFQKHLPSKDLGSVSASKKAVTKWIEARAGEPCARMEAAVSGVVEEFEGASAHDTARDGLYRLACLSAEGHPGLSDAVSRLHEAFTAEVIRDDRDGSSRGLSEAETEWLRFRDGAVKKVMRREDDGDFIGAACTCTGFTPEGKPKERIDVGAYHISNALSTCYAAARARPETQWLGLYHSNGELREMTPAGLRPLGVNSLRPLVARTTEWIAWRGGDEPKPIPANPPREFLGSMLEDSTIRDELPEIRGVMRTPYYALVDGSPVLLSENGYHDGAKVYMQMDDRLEREMVEHMRTDPPYSWVERAKKLLADVFVDFPFVGPADRATAYAALILPFVRDLIEGPTPLHLIDAPTAGTGKGLLSEVIGLITCGALDETVGYHTVSVTDDRNRNVELAKEITARLRDFPRVLVLDNINHKLDSGPIASALTLETFQARLLGSSETIQMPNRALWVATSNNLKASEEIRRRIIWCRMNARVEKPAERTGFKIPNLLLYVRENRPALVWAVLTLVANWVAEGRPGSDVKLGKFESWTAVVPGILECAGIAGLLDNRRAFDEAAADDDTSLDGLVEEWYAVFKRERVSVDQILGLDAIETIVPTEVRGRVKRLSMLLKDARERVIAGHMVVWTNTGNLSRFELAEPRPKRDGGKRGKTGRLAPKVRG